MEDIIRELKQRREALDTAIQALEGNGKVTNIAHHRRGGRRHMSADARARISAAMKKRWAQRKRAA